MAVWLKRTLAVVLCAAVAVGSWRWWSTPPGRPTPAMLAEEALHAPTTTARQKAAAFLCDTRAVGIPEMRRVFAESQDNTVRGLCLQGLANAGDYDSIPLLLSSLTDPNPIVGRRAAQGLSLIWKRKIDFPTEGNTEQRLKAADALRETWKQLSAWNMVDLWRTGKPLAYYYDRNTKKLFVAPAESGPIATPSGPIQGEPAGVRAAVFTCRDTGVESERFVAYLSLPAAFRQPGAAQPDDETLGQLVAEPGSERWFRYDTREGQAVMSAAQTRCRGTGPLLCQP